MSYRLTDFLISLADPKSLALYQKDPDASMTSAGLSPEQQKAVRNGDLYRIRRMSAQEMLDKSLHAQVLMRFYNEYDPEFKYSSVKGNIPLIDMDLENDVDTDVDVDTDTDQSVDNTDNGVDMTDLGDDIAEFSARYNTAHYYDHLFDTQWQASQSNELVLVGTGINGANHLSAETLSHIASADKVLYCVADLAIERQIQQLNPNVEDLYIFYGDDKPRRKTYEEMVERILSCLHEYRRVCAVFYGHPGIFVWPSFKAIQIARREGYRAYMLPAISSLDCLFADIGFDPSRHSCQILEATDMLTRSRKPDTTASVIIFQVGCVGDLGYNSSGYDRRNVPVFAEYLSSFYGADYEVILYEAAQYPVCQPKVRRIPISGIVDARPSGITTMYIPPKSLPEANNQMLVTLGLNTPAFVEPQ